MTTTVGPGCWGCVLGLCAGADSHCRLRAGLLLRCPGVALRSVPGCCPLPCSLHALHAHSTPPSRPPPRWPLALKPMMTSGSSTMQPGSPWWLTTCAGGAGGGGVDEGPGGQAGRAASSSGPNSPRPTPSTKPTTVACWHWWELQTASRQDPMPEPRSPRGRRTTRSPQAPLMENYRKIKMSFAPPRLRKENYEEPCILGIRRVVGRLVHANTAPSSSPWPSQAKIKGSSTRR